MPLAGGVYFGEGPRWFERLLWFSDMLGEAIHTVNLRGSMTTVPLPGHTPSGLGFRPDGSLVIASASDRQVLCYDGDTVTTLVDLGDRVPADLGDMVVDGAGRAYIGSQAYSGGVLVRVDPDASVHRVAEDLDFPNGMVITSDGGTLIVAESMGRRLTRFTIDAEGGLQDRRVFADGVGTKIDIRPKSTSESGSSSTATGWCTCTGFPTGSGSGFVPRLSRKLGDHHW